VCEANVNTNLIEKHWDSLAHLAASRFYNAFFSRKNRSICSAGTAGLNR